MEHKLDTEELCPPRYRGLYEWVESLVTMLLLVIFVLTFVGQSIPVSGYSMSPTLRDGDQMIVRNILYTPRRGDMIVFARHDLLDGAPLVKRVIAVAGDVVDINTETGTVYVNGLALEEPYASEPTSQAGNIVYPHTVLPGYVFVLGDNRSPFGSLDSRHTSLGLVDEREILGQVAAIRRPLDRAKWF